MEKELIYEAVDVTGDEHYYLVGFWFSKEEAIQAIDSITDPEGSSDADIEDRCEIEIREHKIGFHRENYKVVFKKEWERKYDDGGGELGWESQRGKNERP